MQERHRHPQTPGTIEEGLRRIAATKGHTKDLSDLGKARQWASASESELPEAEKHCHDVEDAVRATNEDPSALESRLKTLLGHSESILQRQAKLAGNG